MDTTSVITGAITAGVIQLVYLGVWYFKKNLATRDKKAEEKKDKNRESLKKLLDSHTLLITRKTDNWVEGHVEIVKDLLLWSQDKILYEYASYLETKFPNSYEIKDFELHFGRAIIEYRKSIGYKNKKLEPKHIVIIFRSGYNQEI